MIFDAKYNDADHLPVVIHGEEIAQISQYKYLGVTNLAGMSMFTVCAPKSTSGGVGNWIMLMKHNS